MNVEAKYSPWASLAGLNRVNDEHLIGFTP
jgi:hypothetical protein